MMDGRGPETPSSLLERHHPILFESVYLEDHLYVAPRHDLVTLHVPSALEWQEMLTGAFGWLGSKLNTFEWAL